MNLIPSIPCAALAALVLSGPALAAEDRFSTEQLRSMSPAALRTLMQQTVAAQRLRATALPPVAQADGPDLTPPVLTRFEPLGTVNVAKAPSQIRVSFGATDDSSGLRNFFAYAVGPAGQIVYTYHDAGYPTQHYTAKATNYDLTAATYLAEGSYQFMYASITDTAGNTQVYDTATLASMANTSFTIKNNQGYDAIAPQLTAGRVLTPKVSLSRPKQGTSVPKFAGVELTVSDSAESKVSGLGAAEAVFCTLNGSNCISLTARREAVGAASTVVDAGFQVSPELVAGSYHLNTLSLFDHAGNQRVYRSSVFGGPDDLSAVFPASIIKLVP